MRVGKKRMKRIKKSCGCIVIKEDKVLLIQAKNDKNELFWAFPKGEQESKETDKETALRETKEEVGLEVEIIDEKPIRVGHSIHNGTAFKEILLFIAEPLNDELTIQKQEVERAKWIPISKAGEHLENYYKEAWQELIKRLAKDGK